jgi:parallel beta-helix repeat protein
MKKSLRTIAIVCMMVNALFLGLLALENESSVSGATLYVGGAGGGNFTTIQDAINVSIDGDTVFVYNGTYFENVIVNRTINLIGEHWSNTTIDGGGGFEAVNVVNEWVNISGFTVTNSSYGFSLPSSNNSITNNNATSNTEAGIWGQSSNDNIISDNIVSMNGWYGIVFNLSIGNIIDNNFADANGFTGIRLMSSDQTNITDNTVINNNYGIQIAGDANYISGNNVITNIQYGIYIYAISILNTIMHNNFINNPIQAYDDGTNVWNLLSPIGGNFFSDWAFPDADCDGFVDNPYMISGGVNQDNLPFTEASGWLSGWFNKSAFANYAPSGMPDFDQREKAQRTGQDYWMTVNAGPNGVLESAPALDDVVVNAAPGANNISIAPGPNHLFDGTLLGDDTLEYSYCGPTAAANALWWMDSRYANPAGTPGDGLDIFSLVTDYFPGDDHTQANVPLLIEDLATRFNTNSTGDTNATAMVDGLNQLLLFAGQSSNFTISNMSFPEFAVVANEFENCNGVILFLGFYDDSANRVWGHIVTMSGVDQGMMKISISDPIKNIANPIAIYSSYNDSINVSHDIYDVNFGAPPPAPISPMAMWLEPYTSGYSFPMPPSYWAVVENVVFITPLSASVPTEPLGLSESSGDSYVNLTWSPPADDGGSAIIGYNIYRDDTPGVFAFVPASQLWFNDTSVTNGVTYIYNVTAVNGVGEGPNSADVPATPMTVPSAPQSPGTSSGDGYVNITWSAPADDGGSPITLYNIYRNGTVGVYDTVPASQLWYNDTSVINGVTYTYNISAVNAVGEGPTTGNVAGTPTSSPTIPSAPQNLQANSGDGYVNLTWNAPASDGGSPILWYYIYRNGTVGVYDTVPASQLWYNDTNVINGLTYTYNISAVNSVGEGPQTGDVIGTPTSSVTIPSAPQNPQTNSGDSFVNFTWTAPSSDGGSAITGYNIYRNGTAGVYATVPAGQLWYLDSGLINGITYTYNVTAVNAIGEGPDSGDVAGTPMTVPSAVENLQVETGSGYVNLTWDVPLDDGGSAITNYYVYRNGTAGVYAFVSASQMWYNDTGVFDGITYTYNVSAVNLAGEGPNSTVMATPGITTAPSEPLNLQADSGDSYVNLTWNPPASDGGSAITSYYVYRNDSAGIYVVLPGSQLWYNDTFVTNGEFYTYNVSARNVVGVGPNSTVASVNPLGVPSMPQILEAEEVLGSINLTWDTPTSDGGSPITGYNIYRNGTVGVYATVPVDQLWFEDTNVLNNTFYTYDIKAVNAVGESQGATVIATPLTTPTEPENLQAVAGDGYVELTWTASANNGSSDITAYYIFRSNSTGIYATVFGTEFTYNDTLVQNGINYTYHVRAVNAQGESPNSTNATARPEGIPLAPESFLATPGNGFINLSWEEPFDGGQPITEYFIYRNGTVGVYMTIAPGTLWFNDTDVTNGVTYNYSISANNSLGESETADLNDVMVGARPSPPIILISSITESDSSISFSWIAPLDDGGMPITHYVIYKGFDSGVYTEWVANTTALTYTDSFVTNGLTYYYVVTAESAVGESQYSQEVAVVPLGLSDAPTEFTATAFDSYIILTWKEPFSSGGSSITNYKIYKGTSSSDMNILTTLGNVLSYNDSSISVDVTYFYWISAITSVGEGPKTLDINATSESTTEPENQIPVVAFTKPRPDSIWKSSYSEALITGTANDEDGDVEKVEIRINDGEWIEVNGTAEWEYDLNIKGLPEGEIKIYARSFDGQNYSTLINITVEMEYPDEVDDKSLAEQPAFWLGLIVLILFLLLFFFMFIKKRRPREDYDDYDDIDDDEVEEEEEEEEEDEDEEE